MFIESAIKKHLNQLAPHVRGRETSKLLEAALKELEDRRVRFMFVMPSEAQRERARKSELYSSGDMKLVWVNEGDLIISGSEHS